MLNQITISNKEKFEKFLGSIDLKKYREEYKSIKIVEMNLDRNIQALFLIYDIYWVKKDFIGFNKFYEKYVDEKKDELEIIEFPRMKILDNVIYGKG